jgi:AraC family transcriptional regulator of adaptative response/methylated-DNA-[protein]-cysteine methyltransferase
VIDYMITTTSLGAMLIGVTETGVCCVLIGDEESGLVAALAREFPGVLLSRNEGYVSETASAVVRALDGAECDDGAGMPIDLRGTAFQQLVWTALRTIPRGSTATYTEIAEQIGAPTAVRAVANACAANRIAILVPCHRVVRSDGTPGGYRWGIERKRALLAAERARRTPLLP